MDTLSPFMYNIENPFPSKIDDDVLLLLFNDKYRKVISVVHWNAQIVQNMTMIKKIGKVKTSFQKINLIEDLAVS